MLTPIQLETYKADKLTVIGGKDCAKVDQVPGHGDTFKVGDNIKVTAYHTPCHTQDSICYLFEDGQDRAVFTGDTLFIGGQTSTSPLDRNRC
jgi:hydroxyacylglutathione hydrolase